MIKKIKHPSAGRGSCQWAASAVLAFLFFVSVTPLAAQKTYNEDLSGNRPKFTVLSDTVSKKNPIDSVIRADVAPTHQVNGKVDAVLDSIDRFNLTKRYADGFTAQIYSGQKREDAMNTQQKMVENAPDMVSVLQYVQPKFRVTVGHYFTKLEAQKDMMRLKRIFPNAILVPEKIQIR